MTKKYQLHRWTIDAASQEFGCDSESLSKSLKRSGAEPASDRTFKTLQIVRALFGDYESNRVRKISTEADLLEITLAKTRGELVETDLVFRHTENIFNLTRSGILNSGLLPAERDDLILTLQKLVIQSAKDLNKTLPGNSAGGKNKETEL